MIKLQQITYINELKECIIKYKLTDSEAQHLQGLAGQLNCSSAKPRPDMSYQAREVSKSVKDAKIIRSENPNKA